jgi:hypothetical protein
MFATNYVYSGGVISTGAGLTKTPTSLIAYPGGYYVTETGAILFPANSTCYIVVHKDRTGNISTFTRVSGTHYLMDCVSGAEPALPNIATARIATVVTNSSSVTTVTDRRNLVLVAGVVAKTCSGTDKFSAVDSAGNFTCTADSGGGSVTGTGAANQITTWSGATSLTGFTDFTWDDTNKIFVVGDTNTPPATGSESYIIGHDNAADSTTDSQQFIIGRGNTASSNVFLVGQNISASTNSGLAVGVGYGHTLTDSSQYAVGETVSIVGVSSVAVGVGIDITNDEASAFGQGLNVNGFGSWALGAGYGNAGGAYNTGTQSGLIVTGAATNAAATVSGDNSILMSAGESDTATLAGNDSIGIYWGNDGGVQQTCADDNTLCLTGGQNPGGVEGPSKILITKAKVELKGIATTKAPAVSALSNGAFYFDSTSNTFKCSQNNAAYFDCFAFTTINFTGTYSAAVTYAKGDSVESSGSSYVSIQNGNINHTPASSPTFWQLLASVGATGPTGATGATGPAGPAGTGATVVKPADTSRSSSATPTADPDLVIPVTANKSYDITCTLLLQTTSTGPDFQFGWSFPVAATGVWHSLSSSSNNSTSWMTVGTGDNPVAFLAQTDTLSVGGRNGTTGAILKGIFQNGANAGNITLKWSQNNSSSTAIKLLKNSYCIYIQLQ